MVKFYSEKTSDKITRIFAPGGEQMYLAEGKEKAALIDTGSGVGDLKMYISTLTNLPVIVLITHGHVDHAMGSAQFDEIYMSFMDKDIYMAHSSMDLRKAYLASFSRFAGIEERDYIPVRSLERFHDIKDGDIFDLGGLTIEAVSCAGHSPGSMMFLICEEQALISGDACNFFTMLQDDSCLGLSTYERNLKITCEKVKGRYTTIYLSHGKYKPPVTLLENVIAVCEEIKAGTDDKVPFEFLGTKGYVAKDYEKSGNAIYMRIDGGFGNIVYTPNRIWT
jgi:glyoxylase-like metal-dependent hydrolase (beta-lactamase superfamily II)